MALSPVFEKKKLRWCDIYNRPCILVAEVFKAKCRDAKQKCETCKFSHEKDYAIHWYKPEE